GDFLPLVLAAQDVMGVPVEGGADGRDGFWLRERECRVWTMTVAAGLEAIAPGCRGSMRRRQGWATAFFPVERVRWERTRGPPEGDRPVERRAGAARAGEGAAARVGGRAGDASMADSDRLS